MIDVMKFVEIARQPGPGLASGIASAAIRAAADASQRDTLPVGIVPQMQRHLAGNLDLIAASLAGGMIAASGKPHTAEEAVAVWRGVREAMGAAIA